MKNFTMLILPNYQINTQIYESLNSLVYRGDRKTDNQPVILKILKQDYPTQAALIRYRQEYEIIRDLNLAGVIKVYGIEKYQNTLVIVLEDFGGESLKQLMANQPLTVKAFLPLSIRLSDSLGNIHTANIIHKDINPDNIVWHQETNQLKIIDFGIASRLPRENPILKNPEQLEGTLAYLSPEQTGRMNRSLDYRTDLYSLGVTFYELLTGKVPFESDSAMELVHCHIAKTPKNISEINPDVPLIISDIVMKLMAKNVEDRYQSAFGVKFDLEKCLENLTSLPFELAQNDFSGKLQIPQKLYGRENEINALLQAFERVSQGTREMMLIAGYSGVGKTALVHEVHKPMTSRQGHFAAGKFDQFQKNIPYFAIRQAFNEFCRYLLRESAETLANWQTKILKAVGNKGQIIIDVIPDLELVIGPQPAVVQVGPTETQNRFNWIFLNFIKTLCKEVHPFIVFIDDLQWVDSASLGLLKRILLDDEIGHLLIIGAYRDNEVDNSHPLMIAASELQTANIIINTIFLSNLQLSDINHLLQESLLCEASQTQTLADLVYQKTQGNAFFTHQFLQSLYSDTLLYFDVKRLKWQWDVEKIATQNLSDNVVDFMAKKIDQLPSNTIAVLQLAACIGNQFNLSVLAIIYEHNKNDTLDVLRPAIAQELIQPLDENYKSIETATKSQFKFLHDRVQQAAYALIDEKYKRTIHLQIGRLLQKNTPANVLEEKIFDIVEHFNHSIELLNEHLERLEIAKLNLMAGQKAKMAMAHKAASNYLKVAQECLPENSWESEYELTVHLYTEATEVAYLNGDFKQMGQLSQLILQQAQTISDETKIYQMLIPAYIAQNQHIRAIKTALIFLKRLGIMLPDNPIQEEVKLALQEIQDALSGKSIQSLIDLPMMTHIDKIAAMRVMLQLTPAAYHVRQNLMILQLVKQIELSLKYGNIAESSHSYACYGFILCHIVEDIESGYQFGLLSLELLKRLDENVNKIKTMFVFDNFIKPWKEHVRETLPSLLDNYQASLETGDTEHAAYSIMAYCSSSFLVGKPLATVESEMARYHHAVAQLKQESILHWNNMFWQTTLNLMEHSNNPCRLIGKVYNENIQLERYQQTNNRLAIHRLYLSKCFLHYWFYEYTVAVENADIAGHHLDGVTSQLVVAIFHFYDSLARLAIYPGLPQSEQETILIKVDANQEKMKLWAYHAPMNFQHKYDLVEAEKARVLGQLEAMAWYEKAIRGAFENQYLQEEALAYELATQFYLERGMEKIAQIYLKEAHYHYQQWGGLAKVSALEAKYSQLLTSAKMFNSNGTTTTQMSSSRFQISTQLDLDSVTKASQTLAGEIILSKLLDKMMHLVIENAGAQRGFLILRHDNKWVIEAEGALGKEQVTVVHSVPIENHLPEAIINYVARTQENVVLANASQQGFYTENEYIKAHQTQSVLCFPIVYQQQLRAILYLENNLTTDAFTPQRINLLQMLSSQIAISLENAEYANHLEEKVKQRTTELAKANQEIMTLNERLEEENLRMSAELDVAKQLQQMVLPKKIEFEQIDHLDIACFMEPANEVGGDYYEILNHHGRIKIGIGDVTGHGLESGVLMLMVQTTVRALLLAGIDKPEQFLNIINQTIYHNAQRMGTDKNLTLSLLDYQNGSLQLTGQHEEVLLVRQSGQVERIDTFDLGYSVGVVVDIADWVAQTQISLQPGDGIVLYTDGITEARNLERKLYGIERLCEVVSHHWSLTAQAIQQAVVADVKQYIGTQKVFDDITLLVLKQK